MSIAATPSRAVPGGGPVGGSGGGPIIAHLTSQFRRPRGLLGIVAGRIMAGRGSNVDRNLWLVDRLGLEPRHRVLEVGPGPGVALAAAARVASGASFVALDHSTTMLRQTSVRNRDLIDDGRLTLVEGSAERLPLDLGRFDRIFAMNVWHFWADQDAVIASLVELLEPGGRLAIGYQPRHRRATVADADAARRCLGDQFASAGLSPITDDRLDLDPPVVCVVGQR